MTAQCDSRVLRIEKGILEMLLGIVKRNSLLEVFHRFGKLAHLDTRDFHRFVTSHRESGVGKLLTETQKFLCDLVCGLQFRSYYVEGPQSPESLRNIRRRAYAPAQLACSRVGAANIFRRISAGHNQRHAQSELQAQLLLRTLISVRQLLEHLQPTATEFDRLLIRKPA